MFRRSLICKAVLSAGLIAPSPMTPLSEDMWKKIVDTCGADPRSAETLSDASVQACLEKLPIFVNEQTSGSIAATREMHAMRAALKGMKQQHQRIIQRLEAAAQIQGCRTNEDAAVRSWALSATLGDRYGEINTNTSDSQGVGNR